MSLKAQLSNSDNIALGVVEDRDKPGRYCIMAGNIREGDVPEIVGYVLSEARAFFGNVEESGSAKGSVPGRWDMFAVVRADHQSVLRFVREKLEGSANQFRMTLH